MSIDIDILLEPITVDNPAGEELDYDQGYVSLLHEMQGTPEQQYGDTVIHAVEPDWTIVLRNAQALLRRSKDFRLGVMATRALTRTEGVSGAAKGVKLLLELAERYWSNGHPALQFDGEKDPLPRSNALAELAASNGLVKDLRERTIPSKTLGTFTLGTLERIYLSRDALEDLPLTRDNIANFLQDELKDGNADVAALPELRRLVYALEALVKSELGAEYAPDFSALGSFLDWFDHEATPDAVTKTASETTQSDSPGNTFVAGPTKNSSELSRQEAIAMLDVVCEYLEKCEPANPAPLLIRRARRMIGQDFVSILKDIAPDGLHQVEMIAGISARE